MNKIEQNIKIAEFDGYYKDDKPTRTFASQRWKKDGVNYSFSECELPNYFEDLNAIKSAIENVPDKYVFLAHLAQIKEARDIFEYDLKGYCVGAGYEDDGVISMILASPEELCEALLKTIEKK